MYTVCRLITQFKSILKYMFYGEMLFCAVLFLALQGRAVKFHRPKNNFSVLGLARKVVIASRHLMLYI